MDFVVFFPNFLIGLREGLEAALIVTILLAAVKKLDNVYSHKAVYPIWYGVFGACSFSLSLALVLIFSQSSLSTVHQELFGGFLSLISVFLVSLMCIWMKNTAHKLKNEITQSITHANFLGLGALVSVSFFSIAREGLETTLFLWSNAQTSRQSFWPFVGALAGIGLAIILCILLNKRIVHFNIGKFFNYTVPFLVILAAGVLSYAIGELQTSGVIPGKHWVAWNLPDIFPLWLLTIVQGITQLTLSMTVCQVTCWFVYVACMIKFLYFREYSFISLFNNLCKNFLNKFSSFTRVNNVTSIFYRKCRYIFYGYVHRCGIIFSNKPQLVLCVLVAVPIMIAACIIAILPKDHKSNTVIAFHVDGKNCGTDLPQRPAGDIRFNITSDYSQVMEINVVNSRNELVAEIETLAPHTTVPLSSVLDAGAYKFVCLIPGFTRPLSSPNFILYPTQQAAVAPRAIKQLSIHDLEPIAHDYAKYAKTILEKLEQDTRTIRDAVIVHDYAHAQSAWLIAQTDWEKVGAAYDSFGDFAEKVDGLAWGLSQGVHDPHFTGLHRVEFGIWHNESASSLIKQINYTLEQEQKIIHSIDTLAIDPVNMPLRGHEILEDAQRDHFTGITDYGSHQGYNLTLADISATDKVVDMLAPLLNEREPGLVRKIHHQLLILKTDLIQALAQPEPGAVREGALDIAPHTQVGVKRSFMIISWQLRQKINGDLGYALELLAALPTVLEVPLERG